MIDRSVGFAVCRRLHRHAANQPPVPSAYPHCWAPASTGWRARHIRHLLQTHLARQVSMADMLRISSDTRNPIAEKLTPMLLHQIMTSAYYADGRRLLVRCIYKQLDARGRHAYFNVVWSNVCG
ncbi:MAG: penicillin acylase family protein [Marmoricola sp.]